jgi:hypothetical protein
MSRIRTVKPEYWTSEQVILCSRNARLLFIGLWNFCDDAGVHPASCVRLKAEIFPADNCSTDDVKCWVGELIQNHLLREYTVEEKAYWQVTGWQQHQRIDKPTYRHPLPQSELKTISNSMSTSRGFVEDANGNLRALAEHSPTEWNGEDGSGMDNNISLREIVSSDAANHSQQQLSSSTESSSTQIKSSAQSTCPHENIVALYHEELPMCPPMRIWNKTRRGYLKQRWSENPKHQSLEFWKNYFGYVKKSAFLTGKIAGRDGKPSFVATLEWLVKPNNFAKVIEGKYHSTGQDHE